MSKYENYSCHDKVYYPMKNCSSFNTKPCYKTINSSFRPNKHVKGQSECTIYISRFHYNTTKDTIYKVFAKFGKIRRFSLARDIETGMSKGYGFIEYEKESEAETAYYEANKEIIDGRVIFVDFAYEWLLRDEEESGQLLRFDDDGIPFVKSLELKESEKKFKRMEREREGNLRYRSRSNDRESTYSLRRTSRSRSRSKDSGRCDEYCSRHHQHEEEAEPRSKKKDNKRTVNRVKNKQCLTILK